MSSNERGRRLVSRNFSKIMSGNIAEYRQISNRMIFVRLDWREMNQLGKKRMKLGNDQYLTD